MEDERAFLASLLESVQARLAALGGLDGATATGGPLAGAGGEEAPKAVRAYDDYLREALDPFLAAANALGDKGAELGCIVEEAWRAQRDFVLMAAAVKEPAAQEQVVARLKPVQAAMQKAQTAIPRGDELENHAKAVAEGMQALSWVVVKPAPRDFIENFVGAADFWGNKVRIQHKNKGGAGAGHVAFVDAYKALILGLMAYVKQHHATGLSWNAQGVDIDAYTPAAAAAAAAAAAPAAPAPSTAASGGGGSSSSSGGGAGGSGDGGGRAALFSQLGKGLSITAGLRKVGKEQQTWRPEFKGSSSNGGGGDNPPAPGGGGGAKATAGGASKPAATAAAAAAVKKLPKSSYDAAQFRWNVEHYSEGSTTVEVGDKNQSVYIYGCGAAVVDVRGKGKSVVLDGCKRTQVLVDELLSSLEVVNCQRVKVQVKSKVPTVAIDKTDGIVVLLPQGSLDTNFTTSKSSEMNVQYPKNADGELAEVPIPEQWQHSLEGEWPSLKLRNEVSSLYH